MALSGLPVFALAVVLAAGSPVQGIAARATH